MNIEQLEDLLALMKKLNLNEVRCLDELSGASCDVEIKNVLVDNEGNLVTPQRRKEVSYEACSRGEYEKIFNEDKYLSQHYQSFEDFYNFIEDSRQKEIRLIEEAKEIMLLSPATPGLKM